MKYAYIFNYREMDQMLFALECKHLFGVELDEKALQDKIYDGKWTTPRLYYEDGSIAEWQVIKWKNPY